jgi:hypothetical protein
MTPSTQLHTSTHLISAPIYDPEAAIKAEFGRLIHAALINRSFREKLLFNPLRSIEDGYCGESFHFPSELKERIQLIHAESLESFSMQLLQTISSPRVPERAVLHHYQ